ncbi:MAG: hypothetical protein V1734_02620 [Nanoarchaeota archaeon]
MRKGQIASVDLFIAFFVFILLISILVGTWNLYNQRLNESMEYEKMRLGAYYISDSFVKTSGTPSAWENNPSSVEIIGLAIDDRVLSSAKVDAFANLSYASAREKLKIMGYNYGFRIKDLSNNIIMASGMAPAGDISIVVERYVTYENEKAIMEFALWK